MGLIRRNEIQGAMQESPMTVCRLCAVRLNTFFTTNLPPWKCASPKHAATASFLWDFSQAFLYCSLAFCMSRDDWTYLIVLRICLSLQDQWPRTHPGKPCYLKTPSQTTLTLYEIHSVMMNVDTHSGLHPIAIIGSDSGNKRPQKESGRAKRHRI